jgi:uncharacterized protein HemY
MQFFIGVIIFPLLFRVFDNVFMCACKHWEWGQGQKGDRTHIAEGTEGGQKRST